MRRSLTIASLLGLFAASACGFGPAASGTGAMSSLADAIASPSAAPSTATPSPSATASVSPPSPSPTASDTVWLCRPGLANDPCAGDLDATEIHAVGSETVVRTAPATNPPIDCFYVYPTVSRQETTNANLTIDPEERAVAVAQAARFSQVCDVYAPMYPQLTLAAISKPGGITVGAAIKAYSGVVSAFDDYLANYNHGRGIVFIGHSQGASMLIALLKLVVDPDAALRGQMVSALLLGGNVTVPAGKLVGGSFANIPGCSSTTQTSCVVAYSSFDSTPPADAFFGRPASPLNPFQQTAAPNTQVLCVNPAAPGGSGALLPYYPTTALATLWRAAGPAPKVTTPFVALPGEFSGRCVTRAGATWLQIDQITGSADTRPGLPPVTDPRWGLHTVDVNIALGNLVQLVASESAAYR